jgi:DNA-binding MarR family transcriptional regulator
MAGRREDAVTGGSETATTSEPATTGTTAARSQLLGALFQAGREISAAAVMFHTALSARLGLTATEEKALDLLDRNGPLTGRQLAERSGLAPASVTSLVDRLEAKGVARRTRNPADGRSVLIETTPDRLAGLGPLFADWVRELDELCGKYTDAELAVITDFLTESARRQKDATARLTSVAADKGQAGPAAQPGDSSSAG